MKTKLIIFLALLTIQAQASMIIFQLSNWNLSGTNSMTNTLRITQTSNPQVGGQGIEVGLPIFLTSSNGFFTNAFAGGYYDLQVIYNAPFPFNQKLYFISYDDTNTYNFTNVWQSGGNIFVTQPGPIGPAGVNANTNLFVGTNDNRGFTNGGTVLLNGSVSVGANLDIGNNIVIGGGITSDTDQITSDGNGNLSALSLTAQGDVTANEFFGIGSSLIGFTSNQIPGLDWTNINSGKPTTLLGYGITDAQKTNANASGLLNLNGSAISSGTVADARLSTNVSLYSASGTFGGTQTMNNLTVNGAYAGTAVLPILNGGTANGSGYAQGLTNISSTQIGYWTNIDGYPTLFIPLTTAQKTNYTFNNQMMLISGDTAYGSTLGLVFPLIGTNFVAGRAVGAGYMNSAGQLVTNYYQDMGNSYQIGAIPLQSGTNVTSANSPNIGQGMDAIWVASNPWMFGSFVSGKQTANIVYTNGNFYLLAPQSTNYDGRGDSFAKAIMAIDGNHSNIMVTNLSKFMVSAGNVSIDQFGEFTALAGGAQQHFDNSTMTVSNIVAGQKGSSSTDFQNFMSIGGGGWFMGFRKGADFNHQSFYIGSFNNVEIQFDDAIGISTIRPLIVSNNITDTLIATNGNFVIVNGSGVLNSTNAVPSSFLPYRAGQQAIANLSTSQAVTFSTPVSGTNYSVSLTADGTLAAAVGFGASSKTTNGFTITLSGGITGGTTVDWTAWINQ